MEHREQSGTPDMLEATLNQVGEMVSRSYLAELEDCKVQPAGREERQLKLDSAGRFYRLDRLVLNKREQFLDRLTTILNVAVAVQGSVVTLFYSSGQENAFYMGVISKRFRADGYRDKRESIFQAVIGAARGNLPGSCFTPVGAEEFTGVLEEMKDGAVCSVSGIPDVKTDAEHREYLQGLERLGDAMRGQRYAVLFIADPVSQEELMLVRQGYEELFTQLSPFSSSQISLQQSQTQTRGESYSESLSKSISKSLSLSQSISESSSHSQGTSTGYGVHLGVGLPFGLGAGANFQRGNNDAHTQTRQSGNSKMHTEGEVDAQGQQHGWNQAEGTSSGVSCQFTQENQGIRSLLDRIQEHLRRLELCESVGAVQAAAYVLAPDRNTALTVAGNYSALLRGGHSGLETAYLNVWSKSPMASLTGDGQDSVREILGFLSHGMHPRFYREETGRSVNATTLLNSREAAQQLLFPQEALDGVPVLTMAPFGRNLPAAAPDSLPLGKLCHLGQPQGKTVAVDANTLTSHVFITGSTGSGKSNTVYTMLHRLCLQGKQAHFLVIEPAKGEYKEALGGYSGVHVYGTNSDKTPLLQMNPFSFPEDVHVLEHIDRLVEIFNACWPMYAAMPAVLKAAVEQAYTGCGWSLRTSVCAGRRKFPTFQDVMQVLPTVVDSKGFSNDTQGDYKGALLTRLEALTNGINGQVLCAYDELSDEELFDRNVIVDLSRIGSSETKALLMGVLILKLQEHRMAQRTAGTNRSNSGLQHVTVLEEAHNLLRRTSMEQSQESSNLQGKSVEMLTNAIAEMRTYGEGFVIADQSPGLLDMAAIRNTNTKIILRLPDEGDRMLVGKAAGLNDDQIAELSRLDTGMAAVYQNRWLEPVLCKVFEFSQAKPFSYASPTFRPDALSESICEALLQENADGTLLEREGVDKIRAWIDRQRTGQGVKRLLYQTLVERRPLPQKERGYALYCLVQGKHLVEETRRAATSADEFRAIADRQIMESLMVSEPIAQEICRVILQYAADHIREDAKQYHELQELRGAR